jgi:uncharacterized protein CbrC (UPF0167 family)
VFPLYAAPLSRADRHAGGGRCALCGQEAADRLALGIGDDVIQPCRTCGDLRAVNVHGRPCPHCGTVAERADGDTTCFACLRAGRAALTKDTEYGAVSWDDAVRGRTHGVPNLTRAEGFTVAEPDADGWVSVHIPPMILLELVRTPNYTTWQGERWLFCCSSAMVHVGEWTRDDLVRHVPGDPEAAFLAIFEGSEPWMWNYLGSPGWGFYAFRCRACDRVRGHVDNT